MKRARCTGAATSAAKFPETESVWCRRALWRDVVHDVDDVANHAEDSMPPKTGATAMIAIHARLPVDVIEGVDAYIKRLETKNQGLTLSRSDAVRMILREGLSAVGIKVHDDAGAKKKKGAR